jgi:FkbM family methyltransferase
MNVSRAIRGLRSVGRSVEVLRCIRECPDWKSVVPAYVGIHQLTYPYVFGLRSGATIRLSDWEDLTTAWAVFFGDEYRVAHSDRVVVDLGANIGAFTVMAANAAPGAQIIAVEPFPANFERLKACVRENRLEDRVRCRPWAIAAREGILTMDGAAHIPSHTRRLVDAATALQPVEVECYSLETFFSVENLISVDYLKIDIEGAEFDLIAQTPPEVLRVAKTIGIECHGSQQDRERLWPAFVKAGFYARRIARRPFWTTAEMTRK